MRARSLLAVLLALVCAGVDVSAQSVSEQETQIFGDEISLEQSRNLYEASGNVRIEQPGGRVLTADWLTVNTETQMGVAVGNVVIRDGDDVIRAEFAAVNVQTLQALATRASLDSTIGFAMTGETLERTGVNTYKVRQGTFTTCRCDPGDEPRPWQLDVGKADIRVGGYAIARDVTFRVLDTPVLYTPWLILPVKTERQSGLLLPEYRHSSRSGSEVELPVFWAARDNVNILLRPIWLSDRGFKGGIETEYLFGEQGWGEGGASGIRGDDEVEDNPETEIYSSDRWAYWLRHEQPLAPGMRLGTDINMISDNNYPLDFEDLKDEARNARFLDSMGWTTYAQRSSYAGVVLDYADDLQSPDDLDRDDWLLQRLPDVALSSLPRRLGPLPLLASIDAGYSYFYQNDGADSVLGNPPVAERFFDTGPDGLFDGQEPNAFNQVDPAQDFHGDTFDLVTNPDGTEGDGLFQEGELLFDYGHRFDLYPRLELPLRFGPLETLSEVGYRATFYSPDEGSTSSRGLVTGRIDTRMHFVKEVTLRGRQLRHLLEPSLGFAYISDRDQDDNPLFIPQSFIEQKRLIDGDLRVLLRDPSDRIDEQSRLQLALDNRFYDRAIVGLAPRLTGSFRLGWGYDFEQSESANLFTDITLYPHDNLSFHANWGYNLADSLNDEVALEMRWRSEQRHALPSSVSDRRHLLRVSYRYLRDLPTFFDDFLRDDDVFDDSEPNFDRISQVNVQANLALWRQLDLFADGFFSLDSQGTSSGRVGFAFISDCACWELVSSIEQRTRPNDTRFTVEIKLAGLGFGTTPSRRVPRAATDRLGAVDGRSSLWESPAR